MHSSFWKEALARLPQHVQHRHAGAFEAAERIEMLLDAAWESGRIARSLVRRVAGSQPAASPRPLEIRAHRLTFPR